MTRSGFGVREVRIRGFRSARSASFSPGPLCALVGGPSVGKSNVLAAVWMLLQHGPPDPVDADLPRGAEDGVRLEATLADGAEVELVASPPGSAEHRGPGLPVLFLPASERSGGLVAQPAVTELPVTVVHARRHARASGLVYVSDTEPGIRRKRRGSGFHYLGPNGRPITAARTLDRIRRLAIPPAYTDVWICREPRGHLQATGRDARQRKQYRYHPAWRETRDNGKFARMIEFGAQLPRLRQRRGRKTTRRPEPIAIG